MSVEQISENIWFILFAYIAAFLPWSFLAAKDFVGPRWKTVKETRTSGKYTAAFSVIPACYVMAYMIVQGLSTDYKEMSAALVALVFSCLNFVRTLWGLWQLDYFREWAISSILALKAMGVPYVATFPEAEKFTEIDDIVDHLLVNETIVDNQLAHGEARCYLKYGDIMLNGGKHDRPQVLRQLHNIWKGVVIVVRCCVDYGRHAMGHAALYKIEMVPVQPANVWLNWSVAFVAQGLGGWLKDFSAPVDPENEPGYHEATCRERLVRRGQHFGLQLVNSALLQLWYEDGLCDHGSSTSPLHWCGVWDKESFMQDGVVVKKELLRKAMESGIAMPFQASHDMLIGKDVKQRGRMRPGYHAYRRKLVQIVNEIPVRGEFDEQVGEFDTEKLEWLSIVLYMGRVAVGRRRLSSEKVTMRKSTKETSESGEEEIEGSQALKNLRTQVYLRDSSEGRARKRAQVSSTCEVLQCVSVRIRQPAEVFLSEYNRHVAKAGEMVDAWLSLVGGSKMAFLSDLNESKFWEDVCGFRDSCDKGELDIFSSDESKAIQEIHAEVEKRQFYYNFANTTSKYTSSDQFMTFMGYGMETVRSRLGRWVVQNRDVTCCDERFAPLMENIDEVSADVEVELSEVLFRCLKGCNLSHRGFQTRLLWELQQALAKSDDEGPGSVRIIMLCVLSFPSVRFETAGEERYRREEVTCETRESCVVIGFCDCVGRKKLPRCREDKRRIFPGIKIYACGGPQRVEILGTFSERDGKLNVKLRLLRSEEVKRFRWTLWRDAFAGRLKGLKEWQEEHGILSADLNLTYGEMNCTVENVELPTGENVICWGGWKPFRFEIMRFELESEGFLKDQFLAGEERALHLMTRDYTKQPKDRAGQLLTWQAKAHMYYCLDSLPRMRVEPVDYAEASGITLRNGFLIVEEALVGETTEARVADDDDPSKLLIKYAEKCLRNGNDLERAVSFLEIAATVYGNGIALEECVRLLIERSGEKTVSIRVLRLLETFLGHLYSALSSTDPEPLLLFHTGKVDDYLFPTCSKVMERFGDDDLISGRLSTLFAHLWIINQAHFGKKTLAALQTLYSMSKDVRVMETISQVLYNDFSYVNTDKELLRNVEHFTGLNGFLRERYASASRELNRDTLQACKAFTREGIRKLEGVQRIAAEIRLATATAWGSSSCDEVYQKAVALYREVIESSRDKVAEVAIIINWATLVIEGGERPSEKDLDDVIGFTIDYSHRHGETGTMLFLAQALQRGSKDRAELNKKAVGLYRGAVESGDAVAMNSFGWMLEHGAEGVKRDTLEASKLYYRAIEGGNFAAMTNLASMLEDGANGVSQDAVEAEKLYREAIEHGSVKAMTNLALMLEDGADGVAKDAVEAAKLYRDAIEHGSVKAMTNLAFLLEHGAEGVEQDAVEAAKLYRRAIEGGDDTAMFNLAWLLEDGAHGVAQDAVEAAKLYRDSAKCGNADAITNLGEMLQYGAQGVAKDTEQAVELYRRAIESGDDDAMCNLGLILQDGTWEIGQDAAKAEELYRRAMECGNVNAIVDLALMLEEGREGVAQDAVEASKLYRGAIEGGNVDAMCNLGLMLQHGMGNLRKDTAEAAKLFRCAIEGGDADAMYNLGLMLESGAEGVAQDSAEAAKLFRNAMEYGNLDATWNLAVLLQNGSAGVEQNIEEARVLMNRAWEGLCNGGCG